MANADLKDDGTNLPRVHNALYFPDLTVFGPAISIELYPMCGSLGWKISTQAVSFLNTHSIYDFEPMVWSRTNIMFQLDIGLR